MPQTVEYYEVTLVYADQSTWFAGGFNSLAAAQAWIAEEQTRPYWQESTQIQLVDKSYQIPDQP